MQHWIHDSPKITVLLYWKVHSGKKFATLPLKFLLLFDSWHYVLLINDVFSSVYCNYVRNLVKGQEIKLVNVKYLYYSLFVIFVVKLFLLFVSDVLPWSICQGLWKFGTLVRKTNLLLTWHQLKVKKDVIAGVLHLVSIVIRHTCWIDQHHNLLGNLFHFKIFFFWHFNS